ncbi:MAG: hypothetical protein V2I67_05150, partial [Thermoanaerobaculales bacterium]|nr:hypothetical protein [Thermoanaerobaculales bacterium]
MTGATTTGSSPGSESAVFDHDAYAAFKETGLFGQEIAQRLRSEVLAVSGTADFVETEPCQVSTFTSTTGGRLRICKC